METTVNPIDSLKQQVLDVINAEEYFGNIPAISDEAGDVINKVQQRLNALGLSIVVETAQFNIGSWEAEFSVVITVEENVLINRSSKGSGKKATDVIWRLLEVFQPSQSKIPLPIRLERGELASNVGSVIRYQLTGSAELSWKIKS